MRNEIPEGYELVVGHSADNARAALAKAEDRGLAPETVVRSRSGYLVPLEAVPEVTLPPANVEEARERAAAAAEAEASQGGTEEDEEIVIPDPEKTSHADIDAFAEAHGLNYDGITAENPEKPTKAEKVAHLTAALEAAESKED